MRTVPKNSSRLRVMLITVLITGVALACFNAFYKPIIKVVSLPADYRIAAVTPSYTGPAPAEFSRPKDPFPFPIPLGGIGPAEPLFAGPKQYPFACDTIRSGLGPPEVDNVAGVGTPVFSENIFRKAPVGYSADCQARTRAKYYFKPRGMATFFPWIPGIPNVDVAVVDGHEVPFIVRVEMGTINRFVYAIAVIRGENETLENPTDEHWNHRLIYQFKGGVGIGFRQGNIQADKLLKDRIKELAQGYAVIASSGNATSNHYNPWLEEDIALRVKHQFTALYGEPIYTVGVGGSGGGVQQYLLAQNRPGLIDAAIAQVSFPDMVSQIIPVFDCELMEYYFDVTVGDDPFWQNAQHRQWIEGFNAIDATPLNYKYIAQKELATFASLARHERPHPTIPTECAASWRALTPLVLNPRYAHFTDRYVDAIAEQVHWSHFDDLKYIYGTDENGYALIPWDNVGVQYGLFALKQGWITPEQFLHLNFHVGSWKAPADMQKERYWRVVGKSDLKAFSPWSAHNMRHAENGAPAPRFHGSVAAMKAAYRSGIVFNGKIDIPVIDVRYYLDPELNMHHASASFSTRLRMQQASSLPQDSLLQQKSGIKGKQVIWISDKHFDPTSLAFAAMDRWLMEQWQSPTTGPAKGVPDYVSDRCLDSNGNLIAQGEDVWNGEWNQKPDGACMQIFPIFSNSRVMAGDSLRGDVFKCALQSVDHAIATGVYAPVAMAKYRDKLMQIFPEGVCDYSKPLPDYAETLK